MSDLKKYDLFDEYNKISIYGTDPVDAVNRQKSFPRPRHQEGEKLGNFVATPDLVIDRALEIEDTSNSTRGSNRYIRVIAETADKKIIGIDMMLVRYGRAPIDEDGSTGRNIRISDSVWAAIPEPRSEWVRDAINRKLGIDK